MSINNILEQHNIFEQIETKKNIAFNKFLQNNTIGYNSGLFEINMNLINYLIFLINSNKQEFYIIDKNNMPVFINVKEFLELCKNTYFENILTYSYDYKKIEE